MEHTFWSDITNSVGQAELVAVPAVIRYNTVVCHGLELTDAAKSVSKTCVLRPERTINTSQPSHPNERALNCTEHQVENHG